MIALGAGLLVLLALAAVAIALRNRRRRRLEEEDEWAASEWDEPAYEAPLAEPAYDAPVAEAPASEAAYEAPVAAEAEPVEAPAAPVAAAAVAAAPQHDAPDSGFAWGEDRTAAAPVADLPEGLDVEPGSHLEAAYRGPTPENPSLSLKKRLKRAAFFDQRDRDVEAGRAAPVDDDAGLPDSDDEPPAGRNFESA